jgi:hypothetical protein
MKTGGPIQKWGAGVLGAVSLVLLVHLVLNFNRLGAGNARPRTTAVPGSKATARAKTRTSRIATATTGKPKLPEELARYDPNLQLDLLKEIEDRPLPELERNPFEFPKPPVKALPNQAPGQVAGAPPQAAPPPPPPVTLKPMGYSEGAGGIKEAMVSDEDQVFVVHEGDSVGTRYKIVKITPTVITVTDASTHQTVDLPIPQ